MKSFCVSMVVTLCFAASAHADIQTDWAYHSAGGSPRATEQVPGESFTFLASGLESIADGDAVQLFVLTAKNFAGDQNESVFVRWWDGTMSHWIMGTWIKNLTLTSENPELQLHDLPADASVECDLWRIEIPAWITRPGDNFYAIQLKSHSPDRSEERYLLRIHGGDFCRSNNLGQVWSASEEFDHQDWKINILP